MTIALILKNTEREIYFV